MPPLAHSDEQQLQQGAGRGRHLHQREGFLRTLVHRIQRNPHAQPSHDGRAECPRANRGFSHDGSVAHVACLGSVGGGGEAVP
jgi:hypothetical protein